MSTRSYFASPVRVAPSSSWGRAPSRRASAPEPLRAGVGVVVALDVLGAHEDVELLAPGARGRSTTRGCAADGPFHGLRDRWSRWARARARWSRCPGGRGRPRGSADRPGEPSPARPRTTVVFPTPPLRLRTPVTCTGRTYRLGAPAHPSHVLRCRGESRPVVRPGRRRRAHAAGRAHRGPQPGAAARHPACSTSAAAAAPGRCPWPPTGARSRSSTPAPTPSRCSAAGRASRGSPPGCAPSRATWTRSPTRSPTPRPTSSSGTGCSSTSTTRPRRAGRSPLAAAPGGALSLLVAGRFAAVLSRVVAGRLERGAPGARRPLRAAGAPTTRCAGAWTSRRSARWSRPTGSSSSSGCRATGCSPTSCPTAVLESGGGVARPARRARGHRRRHPAAARHGLAAARPRAAAGAEHDLLGSRAGPGRGLRHPARRHGRVLRGGRDPVAARAARAPGRGRAAAPSAAWCSRRATRPGPSGSARRCPRPRAHRPLPAGRVPAAGLRRLLRGLPRGDGGVPLGHPAGAAAEPRRGVPRRVRRAAAPRGDAAGDRGVDPRAGRRRPGDHVLGRRRVDDVRRQARLAGREARRRAPRARRRRPRPSSTRCPSARCGASGRGPRRCSTATASRRSATSPRPASPRCAARWGRPTPPTCSPSRAVSTSGGSTPTAARSPPAPRRPSPATSSTRPSCAASCCASPTAPRACCASARCGRGRSRSRSASTTSPRSHDRGPSRRRPISPVSSTPPRASSSTRSADSRPVRLLGVRAEGLVPADRAPEQILLGEPEHGWSDAERAARPGPITLRRRRGASGEPARRSGPGPGPITRRGRGPGAW